MQLPRPQVTCTKLCSICLPACLTQQEGMGCQLEWLQLPALRVYELRNVWEVEQVGLDQDVVMALTSLRLQLEGGLAVNVDMAGPQDW